MSTITKLHCQHALFEEHLTEKSKPRQTLAPRIVLISLISRLFASYIYPALPCVECVLL